MRIMTALRHFAVEFDAMMDHARTGRMAPDRLARKGHRMTPGRH